MIGISNDPDSSLARNAHHSLLIGSLPDEMVAIQSYTGTVLALMLLGSAAMDRLPGAVADAEILVSKLGVFIDEGAGRLHEWDTFLNLHSPVHLLGRGPSCGSALEGALLFNETAKFPAAGMPAASFRHGPVELVDSNFVGFIFAPEGCTRDLNTGLAADLHRFGGHVCVIGPEPATPGPLWHATPRLPALFAPVVEVVPLQFAALRLAQLRGLTIGAFRYTPQVTRDEARFFRPPEHAAAK